MEANAVSSALFTAFCSDLGFPNLDPETRFDPFPWGIPPELGLEQFRRVHAICALLRKSEEEVDEHAEERTLNEFLLANEVCASKTVRGFRTQDFSIASGLSISCARRYLWDWFSEQNEPDSPITMAKIETAARFGPGRSVGLGNQPSHLYFKVGDAPMTAGSDFVRSWYNQSVSFNPLCEAAEMARKARWGEIEVKDAALLSFVLKKYTRKRIVVTEPTAQTYFQLGLGKCMEGQLRKHVGLDLSCQPALNSELARLGSIDGSFATMDEKQCSDYISLALSEFMFPPCLFRWFKILRMGTVEHKGVRIKLSMTSTMGNGFTFPMQTALLASLVLGVYNTLDIPTHDEYGVRNWGVFGDDIAVVTPAFNLLSEVLTDLGLVVNVEKSFSSGPFRESCGADFYEGTNVRPVSLKRYTTDQDLFSCFNRLAIWSSKVEIPLPQTLQILLGLMKAPTRVPPDEGVVAGIILPVPDSPQKGWWEYRAYVPIIGSIRYEPWVEYDVEFVGPQPKAKTRRFKKWLSELQRVCSGSINEPALLKALLHGGVRRGRVAIRSDTLKYRLVTRGTPRWGYHRLDGVPLLGSPCFERWQETVSLALETFDV